MKPKLLKSTGLRGFVILLLTANLAALGQVAPEITIGRPTDWTHHRLVFSDERLDEKLPFTVSNSQRAIRVSTSQYAQRVVADEAQPIPASNGDAWCRATPRAHRRHP